MSAFAAVAFASPDETVSFSEPQPGGTVNAASQPIGGAKKVIVGVQGDLAKTTVAVDGGFRKAAGEAVAACWLAGPEAIPVKSEKVKEALRSRFLQVLMEDAGPEDSINICMVIVRAIAEQLARSPDRAVAAAGRCRATPLNFRLGSKGVTLARPKAGPKTRYSCANTAGGINLTARDARGRPLRRALGPKLDVGLYKSTDGPPSNEKMSLRYRLR